MAKTPKSKSPPLRLQFRLKATYSTNERLQNIYNRNQEPHIFAAHDTRASVRKITRRVFLYRKSDLDECGSVGIGLQRSHSQKEILLQGKNFSERSASKNAKIALFLPGCQANRRRGDGEFHGKARLEARWTAVNAGPMYAKIFAQIFDSSIAGDWQVRHVFEDMLKLADANGVVDMTPDSISRRAHIPIEIVARAIDALEKPDPQSRNPREEGRRILRPDDHRDWGWIIVNYELLPVRSSVKISAVKRLGSAFKNTVQKATLKRQVTHVTLM